MSSINNNITTKIFNELLPGAHSNKAPAAKVRIFQSHAQGSRTWDIDGNEYVDYTGASGPNILGHRHPTYVNALKDYLDNKSVCTGASYIFSEDDIPLAEKLIQHVPCAEQVKLCVTGSEAVQQAIRLSRAFTGRPYYLKFGGHYHGWIDNVIGGVPDPSPKGKPFPVYDDNSHIAGKSLNSNFEGLMIPWDDIETLDQTLKIHGNEIAVIIMEAACGSGSILPRPGYLEKVRELCDQYNIVMCFDEVITGFRVGLQGAQGLFGVTPDICTLGKALGGGMPISAVVGKQEILSQLNDGKVIGAGTFNGLPLAVRAAKTTIEILELDNGAAYKEMDRVQKLLMSGLDEVARRRGFPMRVQGPTGVFATYFGTDPDKALYSMADMGSVDFSMTLKFHENMLEEGINTLFGQWMLSIAHTEKDVEQTLDAFSRVISRMK